MATNAVPATRPEVVLSTYGNRIEIKTLADRIRLMIPGGNKLTNGELEALAQASLVTQCNPFIGEIWYIPTKGVMIGIRGARRHGNEQIAEAGGKDAYWVPDLQPCTAEEAGAKDVKDVSAAYRCVITDSVSTSLFQKMFIETVNSLRASGSTDPVGDAREILGKKPQWVGYGFSTVSEKSTMNKQALAMKRAEADALKRKFDIPFGAEVAEGDTAAEVGASGWIDGGVTTPVEVDAAFPPVENVNQDTGEAEAAIEMVAPLGDKAVKFAAKEWNIDTKLAAIEIGKKKLGNLIEWAEFVEIVRGEQPKTKEQRIAELSSN